MNRAPGDRVPAGPPARRAPSKTTNLAQLRTTPDAMMQDPAKCSFAWVMMQLLDLGHISEIGAHPQPTRYAVTGLHSLDDVAHLTTTVENPLHVALLELSALGQISFRPEKANLRFSAVERAS